MDTYLLFCLPIQSVGMRFGVEPIPPRNDGAVGLYNDVLSSVDEAVTQTRGSRDINGPGQGL